MFAWVSARSAAWDIGQIELMRSVHAGLQCAADRSGSLPESLDPDALPRLCRNLIGSEAIMAMTASQRLGYHRIDETSYRLCAIFRGRVPDRAELGLAVDASGCLEETVRDPATSARRRHPRARKV